MNRALRAALIAALAAAPAAGQQLAPDMAPATGIPDPASRKVLPIAGKVLTLSGSGASTSGAVAPLETAAADLAARNAAVTVRREGGDLRLAVQGDVLFDFDRADIRPDAVSTLSQIGDLLAKAPDQRVIIEGHTDAKGAAAYNKALSDRRAGVVADWLALEKTIARSRLGVEGLGATRPAAPNVTPEGADDPAGRAQNRRVEFVLPDAPTP